MKDYSKDLLSSGAEQSAEEDFLNENLIRIDRAEILRFFDYPEGNTRHANAVVAISGEELGAGLLKHYLEQSEGAQVEVLPGSCTPGTKKGCRLDRWVLSCWSDRTTLFQVEIKNWSANSLGGRSLALDATPDQVSRHKRERWSHIWNASDQSLRVPSTQKVLTPMKSLRSEAVEPILCLWDAMHPTGDTAPWFSVNLPTGEFFPRLWVFSMSAFLRTLTDQYLTLEMPDTVRRLEWLHRLLPSVDVTTDEKLTGA